MFIIKENTNLENFTVIIPSVGVGNAAQLAVDLLVETLKAKRIGSAIHRALIPIYGPSAYTYDTESKISACELYADESNKFALLQIRSPLIGQHITDFHTQLVDFFSQQKCSRILILGSCFAYEKHVIESSAFEYTANEKFQQLYGNVLQATSWTQFDGKFISGNGNGLQLLKESTDKGFPACMLFKYVMEGDNTPDAAMLLNELGQLVDNFGIQQSSAGRIRFVRPSSWELLFGNEPGDLIF